MTLAPYPAAAPVFPAPGFPSAARVKVGMTIKMSAHPHPASIPMPVASDPKIIWARRHGDGLSDRSWRFLRCNHFNRCARKGGGRRHLNDVMALNPDRSVSTCNPPAWNPRHPRLGRHFPTSARPLPALVTPAPVAADPDIAGTRRGVDDFNPRWWRLACDDHLGASDGDADIHSGICAQLRTAADERKKCKRGNSHLGGLVIGIGDARIEKMLRFGITARLWVAVRRNIRQGFGFGNCFPMQLLPDCHEL